ncbi:MAG: hypothetical protein FJX47_13140 [Alphaproteobacteria bacterium]|nr:hypothetical protein [Alphaproteobacteria bacterium]
MEMARERGSVMQRLFVVAIALALLGGCQEGPPASLRPKLAEGPMLPWIDVHAHVIIRGQVQRDSDAVASANSALGDHGLAGMLLMSPPQPTQGRSLSDLVAAARSRPAAIGFLGGGDTLNPMIQAAAREAEISPDTRQRFVDEARRIVASGAVGFGEMTAHHLSIRPGHPYESVPADHPLFRALAAIAGETGLPIDLHLDLVASAMRLPEGFSALSNPSWLEENLSAFERLLAHDRRATIVWAHAGSDQLGHWTPELSRQLLARHANLFMSLRLGPGRVPANHPLLPDGSAITPRWLALFQDYPDRFVIGADQFFSVSERGSPAEAFTLMAPLVRARTQAFLRALPPEIARKIGLENARRLYGVKFAE